MNQVLDPNKDVMRSIRQDSVGGLFSRPIPRKHVSYNAYEKHIQDIESKLMQKYRCGYSALHKILIREKAEQIRSSKFWNS
mgnify:FL=1